MWIGKNGLDLTREFFYYLFYEKKPPSTLPNPFKNGSGVSEMTKKTYGENTFPGIPDENEAYANQILDAALDHFNIDVHEPVVRALRKRIWSLINIEETESHHVSYLALYEQNKGREIWHAFLSGNTDPVLMSNRRGLEGEAFRKRIVKIYPRDQPYGEPITPDMMKRKRPKEELKAYYEFQTDQNELIGITDIAGIETMTLKDGRVFCISQGALTRSTEEMRMIQGLRVKLTQLSDRVTGMEQTLNETLETLVKDVDHLRGKTERRRS